LKATRLDHPPSVPVLWTVAALAVAALPHLLAMPVQVALVIALILAWRAAAAVYHWPPPPAWLRVLITLGLIGLIMVSYGGLWGRRAATGLLCIMLAAKLMEMYRVRDLRLVASICFFLIATQFLFDESLIYLAYLVAGCWLATLALTRTQQIRERDGQMSDRPILQSTALWHSARLLALSLPVALILFVLFPRLAQPLWGLPDDALDGRSGLSESMSPGSIATLYADDSPAFRVEFDSGQPPPPEQRYWRGPVLWEFDGTTWRRSIYSVAPARDSVPVGEQSIAYEVQLEPHERRWLLALDYPASSDQPRARITADYQLVSHRPLTTLTAYRVISNPDFYDSPVLSEGQRMAGLRLPSDRNPRTLEMAAQWRERYPDDRELIQALLNWFREEPFFYSLDPGPLGRHGADEFLFDLRTGYCEYYASAFAIFMRAAGIPTRIVTGYQGGFWNAGGSYMLVRNSDAHAWNEVWLGGSGWTRIDPTAAVSPQRIERGSASALPQARFMLDWPWVRQMINRFDRVQHLWNQWVLGFDARAQIEMLKQLGLPELSARQLALLMMLVLLIIGLPLSLLLLREARQRARTPAEKAWARLQKRLERRGVERSVADTPMEWARRAAASQRNQGEQLQTLGSLYQVARYGPPDANLTRQFIEQARAFRPERTRRPGKDQSS